ncbi:MAG: hypothetical protein IJ074_04045 [Clostridia bacterium]|nr:hypothetical protein [Clostridia bacterium]
MSDLRKLYMRIVAANGAEQRRLLGEYAHLALAQRSVPRMTAIGAPLLKRASEETLSEREYNELLWRIRAYETRLSRISKSSKR